MLDMRLDQFIAWQQNRKHHETDLRRAAQRELKQMLEELDRRFLQSAEFLERYLTDT
jgi:hypothetical protein